MNNTTCQYLARIARCWLILFCQLAVSGISAQSLYAVNMQNDIYRIEADFSLTYITRVEKDEVVEDIAISPDGTMYGLTFWGEIFEINLATGITTPVFQLPGGDYAISLACALDNRIFVFGNRSKVLYAYDVPTDYLHPINYLGFDNANDITFYKGNLIYQAAFLYDIYSYDLYEKNKKKISCQPFRLAMTGISTVVDSCGEGIVYVYAADKTLFSIDFEEQQLQEVHRFTGTESNFTGLASTSEHSGISCYTPLETANCTNPIYVDVEDPDKLLSFQLYPNPADDYVMVSAGIEVDYLCIYDIAGRPIANLAPTVSQIDISALPPGLYVIEVRHGANIGYRRLVIE